MENVEIKGLRARIASLQADIRERDQRILALISCGAFVCRPRVQVST